MLIAAALLALAIAAPATRPVWPPLVAVALLFLTRSAVFALLAGAFTGVLLLGGPVWQAPGELVTAHLLPTVFSPWHWAALAFTLLLAAFAAIIERSGALASLLQKLTLRRAGSQKGLGGAARLQLSIVAMGFVCFFDGIANALMLGRVGRKLADQENVSREKLAYLVDTTSSAVACLAFLSTWTVTQLTLITESVTATPYAEPSYLLFLKSIPTNFYCLGSLLLVVLSASWNWNPPPMSRAQPLPQQAKEPSEVTPNPLRSALGPILVLLLSVPLSFWILGSDKIVPSSVREIQDAFNTSKGPYALLLAGFLSLLGALLFYPGTKRSALAAIPSGVASIVPALGVLVLAWTLGSALEALETGRFLAGLLGNDFPFRLLPCAVFLLACLISFSTGTSWGTMGLLMPIALGTVISLASGDGLSAGEVSAVIAATIGAVFGGAVFGDHASPFSDTTIVSALACDVSTTAHVATQLPYALLAAILAIGLGYLPFAIGLPAPVTMLLTLAGIIATVALTRKKFTQHPTPTLASTAVPTAIAESKESSP